VDENKRKLVAGWLDKAQVHLWTANEHLKSWCRNTEAIQASQECVELSVKAMLTILGIDYPLSHGWDQKQLAKIAGQIQERKLQQRLAEQQLGHIRLPRLLVLVNFWEQFYLQAKYGIEASDLAPPQELFEREEAELAVKHADQCLLAASQLRYLDEERLAALFS
jgi:HEPN domain-containing protein